MKSQFYQTELFSWHYLDSANLDIQPTIVFLHGFTGSSRDLALPDTITSNYRYLIPDLPGHGKTQLLPETDFTTSRQVVLLKQWLNYLGLSKFHLFGYSMGGRLALQFAVKYSKQLHSLVLVSTTAGIKNDDIGARIEADLQLAQKIVNTNPTDFLTEWLTQPLFQGIVERGPEFIANEVSRRLPIQQLGLSNSLKYFGSGVMPSVWHQLGDIKTKTLVIAGSKDQKYLSLATELATLITDATLKVLPTSHAPLIEAPDLLWKSVLEFLDTSDIELTQTTPNSL